MLRSALFAAATLALGALGTAPAEAAARLPLAPQTPLTAAEWSATGTWSAAAVELAGRRWGVSQEGCAAGPVLPVGRESAGNRDCAEAATVEPVGRRWPNQDECAADAPLQRVWVRRVGRTFPNQDCAAGGSAVVPVGRRLAI